METLADAPKSMVTFHNSIIDFTPPSHPLMLQFMNTHDELQKIRQSIRRKTREGSAPAKTFAERLAERVRGKMRDSKHKASGLWLLVCVVLRPSTLLQLLMHKLELKSVPFS